MDTDKLIRHAYLLELALAGLEAHAEHSSPVDARRHFEPVRELADEVHTALRELAAARPRGTAAARGGSVKRSLILLAWYFAVISGAGSGRVVGPFDNEKMCAELVSQYLNVKRRQVL